LSIRALADKRLFVRQFAPSESRRRAARQFAKVTCQVRLVGITLASLVQLATWSRRTMRAKSPGGMPNSRPKSMVRCLRLHPSFALNVLTQQIRKSPAGDSSIVASSVAPRSLVGLHVSLFPAVAQMASRAAELNKSARSIGRPPASAGGPGYQPGGITLGPEAVPISGAYLEEVPLGAITPYPRQARQNFDQDALSELADAISAVGLL